MSWIGQPPTNATDVQLYRFFVQFWHAIRERVIVSGGSERWPRGSVPWGSGTVSSIVDNGNGTLTITDSAKAPAPGIDGPQYWDGATRPLACGGPTAPYWVGLACEDVGDGPQLPSTYDVVIEVAGTGGTIGDHWKVVRGTITANTSQTLTITAAGTLNAITAGLVENVAACTGRPYFILRSGGPWWSDRWPEHPNDREAWIGTDAVGVSVITDASADVDAVEPGVQPMASDAYAGKTLRVAGVDYEITTNSATQIVIAGLTAALAGAYEVKDGATVLFSGTIGTCESGIYQTNDIWPADLAGMELLIYAGGLLRRVTISGSSPRWLTFAQASWVGAGVFSIVEAGSRGAPGRKPAAIAAWFRGYKEPWWTVAPAEDLRTNELTHSIPKYAGTKELPSNPPLCDGTVQLTAGDVDAWSEIDEVCSPADVNYSPDLFKTLRALQVWIEEHCGFFIRPVSYDGTGAIPFYTFGYLLWDLGINPINATAAVTAAGGNGVAAFDVTAARHYADAPMYCAIFDAAGNIVASTTGHDWDGSAATITVTVASSYVGQTFTLRGSNGWTRYHPREVRDVYPRTAFLPDVVTGELGPEVADPPAIEDFDENGCGGVGQWIRRPASAAALVYVATGFALEAGDLVENKLYRYAGDNHDHPPVWLGEPVDFSEARPDGYAPNAPYWKRFKAGNLSPFAPFPRLEYEAGRAGGATGGGTFYLEDTSKDWFNGIYGTGVTRTHTGTASGGSATTLVDNSIDPDDETGCWHAADRFVGFASPWAGFILEVTKGETVHRAPIVGSSVVDGVGLTITVAAPWGITVGDGDAYAIREPAYNVNRWEGRTLRITTPTGAELEATITANDDTRLYFAPLAEPVPVGSAWSIVELKPGGTYRRTAAAVGTNAAWSTPEGTDPRGAEFRADVTANEPEKLKRFGRYSHGDYLARNLWSELYLAINRLRWTRRSLTWSSRADPAVPENNLSGAGRDNVANWITYSVGQAPYTREKWDDSIDLFFEFWEGGDLDGDPLPVLLADSAAESDGATPRFYQMVETTMVYGDNGVGASGCTEGNNVEEEGQFRQIDVQSAAGYGVLSGVPTAFASDVTMYVYATIDVGDPNDAYTHNYYSNVDDNCGINGHTFMNACGSSGDVDVDYEYSKFNSRGQPITHRTWRQFDERPVDGAGSARSTVRLGGDIVTAADIPRDIPPPPNDHAAARFTTLGKVEGWYAAGAVGVVKWDVAGGLTFID